MIKRLAILGGLPLIVLATPAAAQTISPGAYKATLDYAGCVATTDPEGTRALLASAPGSVENGALARKLAKTPGCTGNPRHEALRGALAERVYLARYPVAPTEPVATGPVIPFMGSGILERADWDVTRCVATRDPIGADMLIRSELGSQAQKDALKRIGPVLGGCIPAGMQVAFDRERLRGLIAEGLLWIRGSVLPDS